jgi:hypothetical protein
MSIVASDAATTRKGGESKSTPIATLEARLIAAQKKKVAVRMISIFGVLLFFDMVTIAIHAYTAVSSFLSDYLFSQLIVISGSWLSFRLWAIFELLDLFLKELKSASALKMIKIPPYKKGDTYASSHTDIVDLSLLTETSSPPYRGPQQLNPTWNSSIIANTSRRADAIHSFSSISSSKQMSSTDENSSKY